MKKQTKGKFYFKPLRDECYWHIEFVYGRCFVMQTSARDRFTDKQRFKDGNCFTSEKKAIFVLNNILKMMKANSWPKV